MSDAPVVNGALIRDLRLAATHTLSDLAAILGLRPHVLRRLEASDATILASVTGQQLIDLAKTLGTTVDSLLARQPDAACVEADDAVDLLAVLYGQRGPVRQTLLATALHWDLSRLDAARETLNARLDRIGLTVQHTPRGWRLALLGLPAVSPGRRRLAATQAEIHGLERPTAKVLYEVVYTQPPSSEGGHPFGKDRLHRLASLENLGAVKNADTRPIPSPALRYALDLP